MTSFANFVYCKVFCVPRPDTPIASTGIYYAKRGTTGIWYWVRSLRMAHRFELASEEACQANDALGNVGEDCLVGFVKASR